MFEFLKGNKSCAVKELYYIIEPLWVYTQSLIQINILAPNKYKCYQFNIF